MEIASCMACLLFARRIAQIPEMKMRMKMEMLQFAPAETAVPIAVGSVAWFLLLVSPPLPPGC